MNLKLKNSFNQELVTNVKNKIKKTFFYASLSAIVLAPQVSKVEAAAINVADDATVTSGTTSINAATITFTSATDVGGDNTYDVTLNATDAFSVASMTDQDATLDPIVVVDNGIVTVTGNIAGLQATAADVLTFTIADDGGLLIGGNVTAATNKTVVMNIADGGDVSFNGGTAQAIAATITGSAVGGTMTLSGAGEKTFSLAVGGNSTHELGALTVATGSTGTFSGTLDAVAVTVAATGTLNVDGASAFTTIANSGALVFSDVVDVTGDSGDAIITMAATGATITLDDTGTNIYDFNTVTATDGFGSILVLDASTNDTAAVQTLDGDIGAATLKIGSLIVGNGTTNGSLTTGDGDVIFVNTVSVQGGNHADEDSILTLADNLTGNITLTQTLGDASLVSTDDVTIDGTIDNSGAAAGSSVIAVSGTSKTTTFKGNIGTDGTIDSITVDEASAVFQGNVTATTMALSNAAGDATFTGTADQTYTGAITATNGEGSLIATNTALLTVTGAVGTHTARLLEVTASDASNVVFESAINALTLDINSNTAAEYVQVTAGNLIGTDNGNAGAIEIATGAVIRLDSAVIDGTTVFDTTEVAANATGFVPAGAFTIIPSSSFNSGTVKFLDGDNADNLDSATDADVNTELALITVQDSALIDYTVEAGTTAGADVNITAADRGVSEIGSQLGTTNNTGAGMLFANKSVVAGSDTTAVTAFDNALNEFNSTGAGVKTALANQVAPQLDSIVGSTVAAQAMTGSVQGVMSDRMASLRSGDAYIAGMSAGDGVSANSMFLQAFGSVVDQDDTKVGNGTQFGYDADTAGVAFGIDAITDGGLVVGLSLSMSNTDLEGKGTGKAANDIDSYTASLYMDKSSDAGYVEGSLTFGISENAGSRIVNTAGLARNYKSEYDTQQVSIKIGGGLPYEANNGAFVTPFASVTGTLIESDAYTETSDTAADALRLRVDQDDVNSIKGSLGIKAHMDTGKGIPMLSLAVNNEFGDGKIVTTNTFQGGGDAFKTSTNVEELSATLGLGYSMITGNTEVNVGYEAEANDDDYLSHFGTVKFTTKF